MQDSTLRRQAEHEERELAILRADKERDRKEDQDKIARLLEAYTELSSEEKPSFHADTVASHLRILMTYWSCLPEETLEKNQVGDLLNDYRKYYQDTYPQHCKNLVEFIQGMSGNYDDLVGKLIGLANQKFRGLEEKITEIGDYTFFALLLRHQRLGATFANRLDLLKALQYPLEENLPGAHPLALLLDKVLTNFYYTAFHLQDYVLLEWLKECIQTLGVSVWCIHHFNQTMLQHLLGQELHSSVVLFHVEALLKKLDAFSGTWGLPRDSIWQDLALSNYAYALPKILRYVSEPSLAAIVTADKQRNKTLQKLENKVACFFAEPRDALTDWQLKACPQPYFSTFIKTTQELKEKIDVLNQAQEKQAVSEAPLSIEEAGLFGMLHIWEKPNLIPPANSNPPSLQAPV